MQLTTNGLVFLSSELTRKIFFCCSATTGPRWAAAAVYIVGFWFLDFANNTVQGPARAMMADLSGEDATRLISTDCVV
jgi:hypothetical protein